MNGAWILLICCVPWFAQDHAQHQMKPRTWTFMQDGVVFAMFNAQVSPRGEREFKAPNWWMGMAERHAGRGTLTFTAMLSLDPATVGAQGYSHIMQSGETYQGN